MNWFWFIGFYFNLNLNNTYYSNQIKSFDTLPVDTSINFTILSLIKPKPPFSSRCGRRKSSYTDPDTEFWFPIPISKEEVDLSMPPAARYLSCRTQKHGCLKEKSLSLNRNIQKFYQLCWTRQTVSGRVFYAHIIFILRTLPPTRASP